MKKTSWGVLVASTLFLAASCNNNKSTTETVASTQTTATLNKDPKVFIPQGYVIVDSAFGKLNNDDVADILYVIQRTDSTLISKDDEGNIIKKNRRGALVIVSNGNNEYSVLATNLNGFLSTSEDGGIYYAPELSVEIKEQKVLVNLAHGRYGYTTFTFAPKDNDLILIHYLRSENRGPVVETETSIDFTSFTKLVKENTNQAAHGEDEVFKETKEELKEKKLYRFSDITAFDEFDRSSIK